MLTVRRLAVWLVLSKLAARPLAAWQSATWLAGVSLLAGWLLAG